MKEQDKEIIIEFVDEDISKLIEEQKKQEFLSDLNSSELEYNMENIERYALYLNGNISFPIYGHYTIDNGMFGMEKVKLEIVRIPEERTRKGVQCLCKIPGNTTKKIQLHQIEIDKNQENIEEIICYKEWYAKHH